MKKADVLLISIIICVCLIFLGIYLFSDAKQSDVLVIQQGARIIYKESIYKDDEIQIKDEYGKVINIVRVKEGTAYMSFADCSSKDCIHMGELKQGSKKQIACLPNKVLVYLISSESEVDGVTR
ncbi:MAG TPA: NusG domain II-containing protein [Clostridia bacterium]|nr:NusG domain II-containing protein [Clostridia bacterium]